MHSCQEFVNFKILFRFWNFDQKEIFVLQIRIITATLIYSAMINIPEFMFFLSFEFMELYFSTNFILKVRLFLNKGVTFDIQIVCSQRKWLEINYIRYQLVHHNIVSEMLLPKHLTTFELGFHHNIYTYSFSTKSSWKREDDFRGTQRTDNNSWTRFHINLPGQALNMQNICMFGNYKNIKLPVKFKTVHTYLKLWKKKWIIGQASTHFKTEYLKYKLSVSIL